MVYNCRVIEENWMVRRNRPVKKLGGKVGTNAALKNLSHLCLTSLEYNLLRSILICYMIVDLASIF